jgi:hypothetical protein
MTIGVPSGWFTGRHPELEGAKGRWEPVELYY